MNALVVYDSVFGNTEKVALTVAETLRAYGLAQAVQASPEQPSEFPGIDLLVLGAPTVAWKPTPAMQAYLARLTPEALSGLFLACFDTVVRMPHFIRGSAAEVMATQLKTLGVELAVPPKNFFVKGKEGPLFKDQLDKAASWARTLAEQIKAAQAA